MRRSPKRRTCRSRARNRRSASAKANRGDSLSKEAEHSRILAAAARKALTPLGFWRKGHSRTWLADRGFWLCVVEFQPSGFSKGSYLNVSAHWLWGATPDILSFDYMLIRRKPWIAFSDPAQFSPLADDLAEQAARESQELNSKIGNIVNLASLLRTQEALYEEQGRGGGWPAFHTAIAMGLSGDIAATRKLLESAHTTIHRPDLQRLMGPYAEALADET